MKDHRRDDPDVATDPSTRHIFLKSRLQEAKSRALCSVSSHSLPLHSSSVSSSSLSPSLTPTHSHVDVHILFGTALNTQHLNGKCSRGGYTTSTWAYTGVSNVDAVAMAGHVDAVEDDILNARPRLVVLDPPARSFSRASEHLRTADHPYGIDNLRGKLKDQVRRETSIALRSIDLASKCAASGVPFIYVVRAGIDPIELPELKPLLTTPGITRRTITANEALITTNVPSECR